MRIRMYLVLEGLLLLVLGGLIAVLQNDLTEWTIIMKSLASFLFVLAGFCGFRKAGDNTKFAGNIMLALLCSMVGDVLLALDKSEGILFVLGVAGFAFAHVMFSVAFCRASAVKKTDIIGMLLLFGVELLLLCRGNFEFQGLFPVLVGYAAVISFMVIKAISLWRCRKGRERMVYMIMTGSVLFLLSDNLLLFWLFGIGIPKEVQSVNWLLYYLAQGCLSASLNEKSSAKKWRSSSRAN